MDGLHRSFRETGMLELMRRLAVRLARTRPILVVLALLGATLAGVAILAFDATHGDIVLFPALIVLVWSVLGISYIDLFARVPRRDGTGPQAGIKRRVIRAIDWMLALLFLVMGGIAADVSLSIGREWLDERPSSVRLPDR